MVSKQSYLKNNNEKKNCETETIQLAHENGVGCVTISQLYKLLKKNCVRFSS